MENEILIVDDNLQNIQVLGEIIQSDENNISIATDGKSALGFIQKRPLDLILLDVMMPVMDGFEVLKELQKDDHLKEIPVILLTALNSNADKIKGFQAGAVDYIVKPFIKDEVLARVNVHLRLKNALKKIKEESIRDPLTGAYNRRIANEMIAHRLKLNKRNNTESVLIMIDIDNLKTVNDNFGHDKGDELITSVSSAVFNNIRDTDFLFRLGGDEFLILFNHFKNQSPDSLIERVKEELSVKKIGNQIPDFSYGSIIIKGEDPSLIDELLKTCDQLMYAQKRDKKSAM
ncbi:MAG: diguanylate cyclase [Spirochaetaceae bacterium]|nr:diguanylate cyclase [Spirochaetaceae bacterium]